MGIFNKITIFLIIVLISDTAISRPISWPGGSTFMYKSNSMISSYYYHYSPSYKYSLGAEYTTDRYHNDQYISLRTTYLIGRSNTKSSQGNMYFTGGLSTKSNDEYFYGIHGDWETRRWFTSFSHLDKNTTNNDYIENEFQVGFAPYLGDYGELHTWMMLKTKKDTIDNNWESYPFVKFFKGDYLMEIGTKNSHWDFHYMIRF